jgi:hypothetical protein
VAAVANAFEHNGEKVETLTLLRSGFADSVHHWLSTVEHNGAGGVAEVDNDSGNEGRQKVIIIMIKTNSNNGVGWARRAARVL